MTLRWRTHETVSDQGNRDVPNLPPPSSLTTIAAIAREYRVSPHLVKQAIAAGDIGTFTIGRHKFLKAKSAHAWGRKILADVTPRRAVA
jgi:hypothetical protein